MNFYIGNSIDEINEQDVNVEFCDELIDFIYKMSGQVSFDMSKLYQIDPYDDVEVSKNDLFQIAEICKYILDTALLQNYEEPDEEPVEMYDFAADEYDADYRKISAYVDEDGAYVLEGKQLTKIFNSTNFTDQGSIRYLYNYIEKQGGIRLLRQLGLREGDTVRIHDFEFEFTED